MQNKVTLATAASVTDANYIIARINGVWQALGTGADSSVYCLALAPDGTLYAGGDFANIGGVAAAHIAKWTGAAWEALGAGCDNVVRDIKIGPDGAVYATGTFHNAGGAAAAHIAKWTGAAWATLGTGLDDAGRCLAFSSTGILYAGGLFHNAGGGAALHVAKWDGAAWSAVGVGFNDDVYALAVDQANNIYAGGLFTRDGTPDVTVNYIAVFKGTAWAALGVAPAVGTNNHVYTVEIGPDGRVYVGGAFTAVANATLAAAYAAVWDGAIWSILGSALNSGVFKIAYYEGLFYFGGVFTAAGGLTFADRVAIWNGTAWSPVDVDLPGATTVTGFAGGPGKLYLGYNTAGTATVSGGGATTITNNGTVRAYPRITVKRVGGTSATLESIQNLTSGERLLFNYPLADGETVVIALDGPKTMTSDFIGNALGKLLPNSHFATFSLLPGDNLIATYISTVGSPTITAYLEWNDGYMSIDGAR